MLAVTWKTVSGVINALVSIPYGGEGMMCLPPVMVSGLTRLLLCLSKRERAW